MCTLYPPFSLASPELSDRWVERNKERIDVKKDPCTECAFIRDANAGMQLQMIAMLISIALP